MSCPKIATFLFACCLTCLAQHQANESQREGSGSHAAPPSNSAGSSSPAAASSNSGSSSSHAASSNNSAGASSPAASSSNLSSRSSQESRNGQTQERPRDRNLETRGDVPHSRPEAPKPPATKPPASAANQKLPVGNQVLQKRFEACRKEGGHIFNGLCVTSIPEAQGYGECNLVALHSAMAKACGPEGNDAVCESLKKKVDWCR